MDFGVHALPLAGGLFVAMLVLEHPRFGLIRVDSFDQVLIDLRQGMR